MEPPCGWFTSNEIPNAVNHWIGVNVSGYRNPDFDTACYAAQSSLPSEQTYTDSYHQAQSIFANDLPAIPLFFRLSVAAARRRPLSFQSRSDCQPHVEHRSL